MADGVNVTWSRLWVLHLDLLLLREVLASKMPGCLKRSNVVWPTFTLASKLLMQTNVHPRVSLVRLDPGFVSVLKQFQLSKKKNKTKSCCLNYSFPGFYASFHSEKNASWRRSCWKMAGVR